MQKNLAHNYFDLNEIKIMSLKPCPSSEQSTVLIKSKSNLVFFSCSQCSGNTDMLDRVAIDIRLELNKRFFTFFKQKVLFCDAWRSYHSFFVS